MSEIQPDYMIQRPAPEGYVNYLFSVTVPVAELVEARHPYLLIADKLHELLAGPPVEEGNEEQDARGQQ